MHEVDYIKLGKRIKTRRKELNLTQEELGKQVDCSSNHISALENGVNHPSVEMLVKLSDSLKISVDYFLQDTDGIYPEYRIEKGLSKKLYLCETQTLDTIEHILDMLLVFQNRINKDRM